MTYSQTDLEKIEQFAQSFLKITDIAVLLDIPAEQLREDIADRASEAYKAYRRGKVLSKLKIRQQEMSLAAIGSPLGIENTRRSLIEMEDDE